MMYWGMNALNHGNSIAAIDQDNKFTLLTDQSQTTEAMIRQMLTYHGAPDRIFWYERPWVKKARQLVAGQYKTAFSMDNLPSVNLRKWGLGYAPVTYTSHHASHAAAGYYTSPFNHAAVVVLDAIGEFECATIWEGKHGNLKKLWSKSYPNSLGLFYSAFTQLLGLMPIRDEHILQQMASMGDPARYRSVIRSYFDGTLNLTYNFHRGVTDWNSPFMHIEDQCDLAASVQEIFAAQVYSVMSKASDLTGSDNLVYMGGCAMNSAANQRFRHKFKYQWSLPNPGDPSSAMGAVLYHTKQRVWSDWGPVKHLEIKI